MTNQEILTKAIEKAIAGGWDVNYYCQFSADFVLNNPVRQVMAEVEDDNGNLIDIETLIFNHDFVKALWGLDRLVCDSCNVDVERDDKNCWNCNNRTFAYEAYQNIRDNLPNWQYHLQMMVIDPDPIAYLERNL